MVVRFYSSVAPETTLSSGITNASTSITVGSVTGFPSSTPYTLALDYEGITEELVQVNNAAGTTLTVARAVDGTSAASHNAGARVRHVSSARDFADSRTHENSDNGIHGLAPGDTLVGEDAVQTLTNKTLVSPTINNPTITGTTNVVNATFSGTLQGSSASTAKLRMDNTTDVTLTSTDHAFQIGTNGGINLRMDNNEIQTVNNGVASNIVLNADGGNVNLFSSLAADSTVNSVIANGSVKSTFFTSTRPTGTSTTFSSLTTGDTNGRLLLRADGQARWSDGTAATDAGISRTGVGQLTVDNTLVAPTLTGTTVNATTLNVSGTTTLAANVQMGHTLVPTVTAVTAAAGWTIGGSTAIVVKGDWLYLRIAFARTGADIVSQSNGNVLGDPDMGTISAGFRANSDIGAVNAHLGSGVGAGNAQVDAAGLVQFAAWSPNQTITSGDTIVMCTSWPLN